MSKKSLCPECKGLIKAGHTDMVYEIKSIKVAVKHVAAHVCSKCGQAFITGHVAEEVNRLVNRVSEDVTSFIKTQPEVRGRQKKEVAIAV